MIRRFFTWLWPTLFEKNKLPERPVKRILLPPKPMYKAPDEDEWRPL